MNIDGETLPQPIPIQEAEAHKPPRSRRTVLVMHTGVADEWIPIREVQGLIAKYGHNPERDIHIKRAVSAFERTIEKELGLLYESRGLLVRPSPEQLTAIRREAEDRARGQLRIDLEEIMRAVCPQCFDPGSMEDPDTYEDAITFLSHFPPESQGSTFDEYEPLLLSERDLTALDDIIERPTPTEAYEIIRYLNARNRGWDQAETDNWEALAGKRFARAAAKLHPHLVRDTKEAERFFSSKAGVDSTRSHARRGHGTVSGGKGCNCLSLVLVVMLIALAVIVFLTFEWR